MHWQDFLEHTRTRLSAAQQNVDRWFDADPDSLAFSPPEGGWSGRLILEHIVLTQHFLLKLIDKAGHRALREAAHTDWSSALLEFTPDLERLERIAQPEAFEWPRPEHMEPSGQADFAALRRQMAQQFETCLEWLERLRGGEGVLVRTTMSVQDLGKISVYEYLLFLAQHAHRHLVQLERNQTLWNTQQGLPTPAPRDSS